MYNYLMIFDIIYIHTALSCGRLDAPENGKVVISGTTPGSITTYSCNPGFDLVGVSKRTCQNNGEWSDDEPFCEGIIINLEIHFIIIRTDIYTTQCTVPLIGIMYLLSVIKHSVYSTPL